MRHAPVWIAVLAAVAVGAGTALYEGRFTLEDALELTRGAAS